MATSFIKQLGNCIYREFSSVLSHDDMEESFKEAIAKMPKGEIRKKLRKNFDKYLTVLEKHIADLSGTEVPPISSESQDDSIHELSSLEQRKDVAEKSQQDHRLAFNLHKPNPDGPDEEVLRDCNGKQKRQIYSLYVRQALTRRDVSFEKLSQVIDLLEQVVPEAPEDKNSCFAWKGIMDHLMKLSSGLHPSSVVRVLRVLFQKVEGDVDNCLLKEKPVRSGKLAKILKSYLQIIHMRIQNTPKGSDDRPYLRYLSALLSYYLDLACVHSCKVDKKQLHGRQICGFLSYLLLPCPERILEVVLQSSMLNEEHACVITPLIGKCVSLKPEGTNHEHYLKYVLVVRMAKDNLGHLEQVIEWTITARQIPAGHGFLDWVQDKCPESSEHLPTEDKKFKKSNITKFLLDEAEMELICILTDSLRSPAAMMTEESFLTSYNQVDSGKPEETTEDTEKGTTESDQAMDTLFFLDTSGSHSSSQKKDKQNKSLMVLKTLKDMETLLDTDDDNDPGTPQAYKLDNTLLDKFVDPDDKEFVQSGIVSIKSITEKGKDVASDTTAKAKQSTSSPKKADSEILAHSRSGKGRVKELHTSESRVSKPASSFVSETESDTSLVDKDNTVKSVVRKISPRKKTFQEDAEKSETETSEAATVFSVDSDIECVPPNSAVTTISSDTNLSSDIGQQPFSLLSQMSDDKTMSSAIEENEIVVIDSETDVEIPEDKKKSKFDENVKTKVAISDDSSTDQDSMEATVMESNNTVLKSPVDKVHINTSTPTEKPNRRKSTKSPSAKVSPLKSIVNKTDQLVSSGKLTSPKEKSSPAKKSRTSDSRKHSGSGKIAKDDHKAEDESVSNMSDTKDYSEEKDESSVFIEIKTDDETDEDEKSPSKTLAKVSSPTSKRPKSVIEKFIQKAEKSTPGKRTDHTNAALSGSNTKVRNETAHKDTSRTKSTEEIVTLVEEIQQKLTESSKKSSHKCKAAENSMFTDESVISNDSEIGETTEVIESKKSPKKSSKSALSDLDEIEVDHSEQIAREPSKRKSSSSDQNLKGKSRKSSGHSDKAGMGSGEETERKLSDFKDKSDDKNAKLKSKPKVESPIKKVAQAKQKIVIESSDESIGQLETTDKKHETVHSPKAKGHKKDSKSKEVESSESDDNATGITVTESDGEVKIGEESAKPRAGATTPKSDMKKRRKRSSDNQSSDSLSSTSVLDCESSLPGQKKQRLSSNEEPADELNSDSRKSPEERLRRRSVSTLKVPPSAEKVKKLKSSQATPNTTLNTGSKRTPRKSSQSDDQTASSSPTKPSAAKRLSCKSVSHDTKLVLDTDSEMENDSKASKKNKAVFVTDSEHEMEVPDIGKHLKTVDIEDDQMTPDSPQIPKRQESFKFTEIKKIDQQKDKDGNTDKKDKEEKKSSPEKLESVDRSSSIRPRLVQEDLEASDDSTAKKPTQVSTRGKRASTAGKRVSISQKKDQELLTETDQSETDTRVTRKSVGGKKMISIKEPEKPVTECSTPPSKQTVRKLSASTSKKAVKKAGELKAGRKRRLSGELSESDRNVRENSTDSEVTFPKMKKGAVAEPKQSTRVSKRLSTSAQTTKSAPGSPTSKRYPSRKK